MNRFYRKGCNQVIDYIKSTYQKITVEPGQCRVNFRCSYNAVHDAIEANDDHVALCFYIDEGQPILHTINCDKGVFTDNTWGVWTSQFDYYLIKYIDRDEFFNIHDIFRAIRSEMKKKVSWNVRLFSDFSV